jgi:hypothetical protein
MISKNEIPYRCEKCRLKCICNDYKPILCNNFLKLVKPVPFERPIPPEEIFIELNKPIFTVRMKELIEIGLLGVEDQILNRYLCHRGDITVKPPKGKKLDPISNLFGLTAKEVVRKKEDKLNQQDEIKKDPPLVMVKYDPFGDPTQEQCGECRKRLSGVCMGPPVGFLVSQQLGFTHNRYVETLSKVRRGASISKAIMYNSNELLISEYGSAAGEGEDWLIDKIFSTDKVSFNTADEYNSEYFAHLSDYPNKEELSKSPKLIHNAWLGEIFRMLLYPLLRIQEDIYPRLLEDRLKKKNWRNDKRGIVNVWTSENHSQEFLRTLIPQSLPKRGAGHFFVRYSQTRLNADGKKSKLRRGLRPSNFWLEDQFIEKFDLKYHSNRGDIIHYLKHDVGLEEGEIANEVWISAQAVNKRLLSSTDPKILKEFRKWRQQDGKNGENVRMGERGSEHNISRRWLMGNIELQKKKNFEVKLTAPIAAFLEAQKRKNGMNINEAVEDAILTKDRWLELEEHFPPEALKDVSKFVKHLFTYWETVSLGFAALRNENRELKTDLEIFRGIIEAEKPGRAAMIEKARALQEEKSKALFEMIRDKTVSPDGDTGEKVTVEVPLREKETEEEYKVRKADNEKWGIKD